MLIAVHHILTANLPVSVTQAWEKGYTVAVSSADGLAVPAIDGGSNNINVVLGLSADVSRASEAFEYVNRVSDAGQETRASGKLSYYHSGGEFWLDIDDSTVTTPGGIVISGVVDNGATVTAGTALYRSATAGGGRLGSAVLGPIVAIVLEASQELSSGLPGEFEPGASFDLADDTNNRNFIKVKLNA